MAKWPLPAKWLEESQVPKKAMFPTRIRPQARHPLRTRKQHHPIGEDSPHIAGWKNAQKKRRKNNADFFLILGRDIFVPHWRLSWKRVCKTALCSAPSSLRINHRRRELPNAWGLGQVSSMSRSTYPCSYPLGVPIYQPT